MIVVTVARRPLSEDSIASNVLRHGCGALNITDNRIAADVGGRWPPNLVLGHMTGCRMVGKTKMLTHGQPRPKNVRGTDGAGGQTVYAKYAPLPSTNYGFASEDGTETVDVWVCEEGCPVASVNAQGDAVSRPHSARYLKCIGVRS